MGPMPMIYGGVSQEGDFLNGSEVRRLRRMIMDYQRQFPQSGLHLLVRSFPQEMDFKVILLWLFNQGGLSPEGCKGGRNRDVVILIEPDRRKAGLIVGYGLEPLLSQEAMDEVVGRAGFALAERDFAGAFEVMVKGMTNLLCEISLELPKAVGLRIELAEDGADQF